jgi:hypothetical protein
MITIARRSNTKMQKQIIANKVNTVKGSTADKEEREKLENVKVADD